VVRRLLCTLAVPAALAAPAAVSAEPFQHVPQPVATGSGGAAATVDGVATSAAVQALRDGGSAVDAAVTAAAVLGVTEPFSCGIGGGGFMVVRTPGGAISTIDSRETAPAAMHPQSLWENGAPLPFNDARYSGLSAGVPGTVAGWQQALERYGTFSMAQAVRPAIEVAREGFVVDQTFFDQTQGNVSFFDDITSSEALFLDPDGTPRDVGTVFRNPDLASTYERIAKLGAKGLYRGKVAGAMVEAVTHPPVAAGANHLWRPGVMTEADVEGYRAVQRAPTHVSYRGLDVWGIGPPSSGGSTVGEALNLLSGFDLSGDRTRALHLFLESSRVAFADRGAWLADPAYFDVPLRGLLSTGFADERRALIDPDDAGRSAAV
jgi:gamma-glutamyltranspeptidase / glutathione hydrolase